MIEQSGQKIFLVGVGRSGTSLLQAMLNAHSKIAFLPETGFVRNHVFTHKFSRQLQHSGVGALDACLASDARIARLGPELASTLKHNGLLDNPADLEHADKLIYDFLHENLHSSITGDKDPKLVEYIDVLKTLWPECKIIHIYRDPRDVLLSKKKAKWSESQSDFARLVANVAQFSMASSAGKRFGEAQLHRMRYETLIENPQRALSDLCEWLGIPFEQAMLTHQKSAGNLVFEDEMQWKSEVLEPVISNNAGKWQEGLTEFEAQRAARCCARAMKAGEYALDNDSAVTGGTKVALFSLPVVIVARLYILYRTVRNRILLKELGC